MLDKPPTESDERDAIHMAVIPAVAGCRLMPGQPVVIKDDVAFASLGISPVGVVNPFRSSIVEVGDRFWLCLKPGTVTGMRHHWEHPAFDSDKGDAHTGLRITSSGGSKKWLEDFAERVERSYEQLILDIEQCVSGGLGVTQHGTSTWQDEWLEHREDLWEHYERVTGKTLTDETKQDVWLYSCSC